MPPNDSPNMLSTLTHVCLVSLKPIASTIPSCVPKIEGTGNLKSCKYKDIIDIIIHFIINICNKVL